MTPDEREGLLPSGRQLAVTWSIPDAPGGMTGAMLRRSRSFVELAGARVDVLTFDARPDYGAVRDRLTRLGELVPGLRLRNLYEELRGDAADAGPGTVATLEDGRGLRVEHRRADGSLAVLDERPRDRGERRRITRFDHDERPVHRWDSAWACYADWIAETAAGERAFAIVDSKTAARFMARIRLPEVVTLHMVHNAHLAGADRPLGPLRASRRDVLARPERFDAIVFLTERQRADATTLLADGGNLAVVPNATPAPAPPPGGSSAPQDAPRDPAAVVVVAGLTRRKRVHHAIEAVALARAQGAPARLRVFGTGPELDRLVAEAGERGLGDEVEFAGHRADAAEAFAEASVTLLTSTSEGAPLVLLEAMSRGCVPIAYDIPYGPADLIEYGVNGFLVAPGDVAALAATVARVASLPESDRARLRAAARRAAARFDDAAVVARWGAVQRRAADRHGAAPLPAFEVRRLRLRRPGDRLRLSARLERVPDAAQVIVRLERRASGVLLRRPAEHRHGRVELRLTPEETAFLGPGALHVGFVVLDGDRRAEAAAGRLHPDTRSLPRRVAGGIRSRLPRREGRG
ncbi:MULTISPECIES: glycosyltransferase [unclassified Agromyces]|uniref:glycosyltransferase n=1 Tax=unclassified Agromyces TaxID=2639701 RepID=UPI003014EBB9